MKVGAPQESTLSDLEYAIYRVCPMFSPLPQFSSAFCHRPFTTRISTGLKDKTSSP